MPATIRPPTTHPTRTTLLALTAPLTAPLTVALTVAVTVLVTAAVTSPAALAARWATATARRLRRDQDGVSDLVVGLLMAGGMALIVIAVLAIIRPWAETEANNLPGS